MTPPSGPHPRPGAPAQPALPRRARPLPYEPTIPGLPLDSDPPRRRRAPDQLKQTLQTVLRHWHIDLPHLPLDTLTASWADIVGPDLATRVRPGKLQSGILYLYADTSTEIFEIRRFKLRHIEARIRAIPEFRAIRQLRLQLNPRPH